MVAAQLEKKNKKKNKDNLDIPFEMEGCALIGTTLYYIVDGQKEGINFDGIYKTSY